MNDKKSVAIIMRSKDEMPYTEKVFEMLSAQTWQDYCVYNVDSGSTDGTMDCVRRHNFQEEHIFQIPPEEYIPGRVLNFMISKVHEPIVVLLNADAIPQDEKWLEALIQPLLDGKAEGALSRQVPRSDALFIVKEDYRRAYDPKRFSRGTLDDFFSAVSCAFKRSIWEETPFREEGYSEDLAWFRACREKGHRFLYVPESVVEHSHNYSLRGLYKKRFRHGVTFSEIYARPPKGFKCVWCASKEMARDFLTALSRGQLQTIPYNVLYRGVIYWAYHQGQKEGAEQIKKKERV